MPGRNLHLYAHCCYKARSKHSRWEAGCIAVFVWSLVIALNVIITSSDFYYCYNCCCSCFSCFFCSSRRQACVLLCKFIEFGISSALLALIFQSKFNFVWKLLNFAVFVNRMFDPWIKYGVFCEPKISKLKRTKKRLLKCQRKIKRKQMEVTLQNLRIHIKKIIIAHLQKLLKVNRKAGHRRRGLKWKRR